MRDLCPDDNELCQGKEHNMYLNSYLTSINCVRGKEHNLFSFFIVLWVGDDFRNVQNATGICPPDSRGFALWMSPQIDKN